MCVSVCVSQNEKERCAVCTMQWCWQTGCLLYICTAPACPHWGDQRAWWERACACKLQDIDIKSERKKEKERKNEPWQQEGVWRWKQRANEKWKEIDGKKGQGLPTDGQLCIQATTVKTSTHTHTRTHTHTHTDQQLRCSLWLQWLCTDRVSLSSRHLAHHTFNL